jgi:hypothetical protein
LVSTGELEVDGLPSATSEAAGAVGLVGRKGVLRPGADADLLFLGSSPLADLSTTTDIRPCTGSATDCPKPSSIDIDQEADVTPSLRMPLLPAGRPPRSVRRLATTWHATFAGRRARHAERRFQRFEMGSA